MSNNEKILILKDFLGGYSKTGVEYLFKCPKCNHHKKKLSVNIDKNVFKCWICDYRGSNIYRLVRKHASYEGRGKWRELAGNLDLLEFQSVIDSIFLQDEEEEEIVVDLPSEFVSLANKNNSIQAQVAKNYLFKRGIDERDILFWKIGFCSGGELYIDWSEDLTLTEGVFDAIIAGQNSVPILGSTLKQQSKLFKSIILNDTPVYVALDLDAQKKASYLVENLIKYGAEVYKIDVFPYNDVGEMPKKEFLNRKGAAKPTSSEDAFVQKFISSFNF